MIYRAQIEKAIDYIEENLKFDLNLEQIAKEAGYSLYHFIRIFREVTGLTPAEYIRKRRITEIIREMDRSNRPIYEIAFEYGFNSKENFTRAFKNEHHILPTGYKSVQNSLKLWDRLKFDKIPIAITPEITTLSSFTLVVFPSDEDYPPNFWNKYNCLKLSKKLSGGKICEDFGVNIWNRECHRLDYFIGIRAEEAKGDLTGTIKISIPGGTYAIFQTPKSDLYNFVNVIHATWEYINTVWLPQSGYTRTGGYEMESYIEDSREFSETIYIPLRKV